MAEYKIDIEKSCQNLLDKIQERFGVSAERLVELANADCDGRCMVLPFKIGDVVYTNISIRGDRYRESDKPYPVTVVFCGIGEHSVYFNVKYDNGRIFPFELGDIGKTVFLTPKSEEPAKEASHDPEYMTLESWLASEEYQQAQQRAELLEQLLAERIQIAMEITAIYKAAQRRGYPLPEETIKARELQRRADELDRQQEALRKEGLHE